MHAEAQLPNQGSVNVEDRAEIVEFCQLFEQPESGRTSVVRADDVVVKFGRVSAEEVSNQLEASKLLDARMGRVPQVHSYFTRRGIDYLVMEFIPGRTRDVIDDKTSIELIARLVEHIGTFSRDTPGPANHGLCSSLLWPGEEQVSFEHVHDIQDFFDRRLVGTSKIDLSDTSLVFTHGDIAPRNFIFSEQGLYLLDWEFAGYYPRSMEVASLRLENGVRITDTAFHQHVEEELLRSSPLTSLEAEQVRCMQRFALNSISHYWPSPHELELMQKLKRKKIMRRSKAIQTPIVWGNLTKGRPVDGE